MLVTSGLRRVPRQLDRLARPLGDLLAIVSRLEAKKVSLRVQAMSGTEALDTSTAMGRLMMAVSGAVGQAERETMLERQREGIAKAQREGRYEGRAPTVRRQTARDCPIEGRWRHAHGNRCQVGHRSSERLSGAWLADGVARMAMPIASSA